MIRTRLVTAIALLSAAGFVAGCGDVTYESLLPDVWPDGLKHVYDQHASFLQPTDATPLNLSNSAVGDLASLVGCWGNFFPDIAAGEEPVQIDIYAVMTFRADGTYTQSFLQDTGGEFPVVVEVDGTYARVDDHRIALTNTTMRGYNPLTRAYDVTDLAAEGVPRLNYLVALHGDALSLEALAPDETGDEGDADGTIVYQRFDCGS